MSQGRLGFELFAFATKIQEGSLSVVLRKRNLIDKVLQHSPQEFTKMATRASCFLCQ